MTQTQRGWKVIRDDVVTLRGDDDPDLIITVTKAEMTELVRLGYAEEGVPWTVELQEEFDECWREMIEGARAMREGRIN